MRRILLRQLVRIGDGHRLTDYVIAFANLGTKDVAQSLLDEIDRERRDVNSNPTPLESLRGDDRSATSAERVENEVALVAARFDDAFEQRLGLLGGIAEAFLGLRVDRWNIVLQAVHRLTF